MSRIRRATNCMQTPPYHGELTVNPYLPSDAAFCRSVLLGSVVYYRSFKPTFASLFYAVSLKPLTARMKADREDN